MFSSWIFGWREKTYHYVTIFQYIQKNIGFLELAGKIASVIFPGFHLFLSVFFGCGKEHVVVMYQFFITLGKFPNLGRGKSLGFEIFGIFFIFFIGFHDLFPGFLVGGKKIMPLCSNSLYIKKIPGYVESTEKNAGVNFPRFLVFLRNCWWREKNPGIIEICWIFGGKKISIALSHSLSHVFFLGFGIGLCMFFLKNEFIFLIVFLGCS